MTQNPYRALPETSFWSSGVKSPLDSREGLAITPLLDSLSDGDTIVSGGSCFAQYIGQELLSRGFRYLRSTFSGERIESFGIGNIYSIAQLRQWLEVALGRRRWSDGTVFEEEPGRYVDYLLPHRPPLLSLADVIRHRKEVSEEMLHHLSAADLFVFTLGLTETWKNEHGDILPACPGTLAGEFDEAAHAFRNCTFDDIVADLEIVENLLSELNPSIRIVLTVSPVPLTATATGEHVLLATTYSKSVIRAAVGQFCRTSERTSYFPSYELIHHHVGADWRFEDNLRSVSRSGVGYVMSHAFGEDSAPWREQKDDRAERAANESEAVCEEEMLDAYARSRHTPVTGSDLFLIGDSHLQRLAKGLESIGVTAVGGQVMNGSGFSDNKLELSDETIFVPLESDESKEIWHGMIDRLKSLDTPCNILTNIGFQTHRTINRICNDFGTPILTAAQVGEYLREHYADHISILREFTRFGRVWLVEDPNFYAFLTAKDSGAMIRDKNFHLYCSQLREIAGEFGIEYLAPCDLALHHHFEEVGSLSELVAPDGFHGTPVYYEYSARIVNAALRKIENAA